MGYVHHLFPILLGTFALVSGCGSSETTPVAGNGTGGTSAAGTGGASSGGTGANAGAAGAGGTSETGGTAGTGGAAGSAGAAGAGGTGGALPTVSPALESKYNFEMLYDSVFDDPSVISHDAKLWRREDMGESNNAAQHRHDYGRRHAAWYDRYHSETVFIENGYLVQRGYVADSDLPGFASRDSGSAPRNYEYTDPDPRDAASGPINFADFEIHTSWFDTFALKYSNGQQVPVESDDVLLPKADYIGEPGTTDTLSPNVTFLPGTYFEIHVSFEGMEALSHRHSFWLMPGAPGSVAYDSDPQNGLEIDIYEHELALEKNATPGNPNINDYMLMKCIGGSTSPKSTENELRSDKETAINIPNINIGWHKVGLLWMEDELIWLVDGVEVVKDTQLVPNVAMYMIMSREANTGAKSSSGDPDGLVAVGDSIPSDAGLFGRNVATPANRSLMKAGKDEVRVRYVRAWRALLK